MKIEGFQVPDDVLEHYRTVVREADDEAVLWYAKSDPDVARGLRLNATSVPGIRTRILGKLNRDGDLPAPLRGLLILASPLAPAIQSLASAALTLAWDSFLVTYGTPFVATALLDEREAVRECATDALQDEPGDDGPAEEEAAETVAEILAGINEGLSSALPTVDLTVESPHDDGHETDDLRDRMAQLEQELADNRTRSRQLKALQKKLAQSEKRQDELKKELDRSRRAARSAEASCKTLQQQVEALLSEQTALEGVTDKRLEQRLNENIESIVHSWLVPMERLAGEATRDDRNLLERARAAIDKQARIDQHAGNRLKIAEKLDALHACMQQVRNASAAAVQPVPELAQVEAELDREIARLESVIGCLSPEPTPVEGRVSSRIKRAASLEDLEASREMLQQLESFGILEQSQLVRLYQAYNQRMAVIYSQFGPRIVKAAEWDDPVWRLRHTTSTTGRLQLLVDGYNALHLASDLFADDFEDDAPRAMARDHLVGLLQRMFYAHPECEVRVYWDSNEYTVRRRGNSVREIFSGGDGEHRADRLIVHDLHRSDKTMQDLPRILVTDDRDLREQARQLGAQIMGVTQFSALLEDLA